MLVLAPAFNCLPCTGQVSDLGLEAALTTRAIVTRGERIVKRLDAGGRVGEGRREMGG